MLSYEECRIIARNKCAEMFGWDFVNEHKPEFCSQTYVDKENDLMEYTLLWSPFEEKAINEEPRIVIEEIPFDYYASVIVDMNTGTVWKDPDDTITKLPS